MSQCLGVFSCSIIFFLGIFAYFIFEDQILMGFLVYFFIAPESCLGIFLNLG